MIIRDKRNNFRFCKNRTHARDGKVFLPLKPARAHLIHVKLERTRHHLKEAPRTCGALIVHDEVRDLARFIKADDLAILSTDVHDRTDLGIEVVRTMRMTADLGFRVGCERDIIAPVAGSHDGCEVLFGCPELFTDRFERFPGSTFGLRACAHDSPCHHCALFVEHDHVRGGRAAIDSCVVRSLHIEHFLVRLLTRIKP